MSQATPTHVHERASQPCGCRDAPPSPVTCCDLVCFERPNYFCGHLLTDADLALEQRYVIEKNKLRNRALHGHGIVCGLELTCDAECAGYIRVGTGYAIDDCGNDLVVCEPQRVNVIDELLKKQWLLTPPKAAPCEPETEEPDCDIKQCFYVTACYEETSSKYTTPFDASCHSGPVDCLPTRVAERVRFEITDTLPSRPSYAQVLKTRIEHCFKAFSDGPVGRALQAEGHLTKVEVALAGQATAAEHVEEAQDPYCELFCLLRAQFLHHLLAHPDQHRCGLYAEVKALSCPKRDDQRYSELMKEAYCRLVELMLRYVYECVIAGTLITCPEVCEAHCVVLGTVEVRRGQIVRVCNTPRTYVWSFANLVPLVYHYLLTRAPMASAHQKPSFGSTLRPQAEAPAQPATRDKGCCPEIVFGPDICESFIREFRVSAYARTYAAMAPLTATQAFLESLLETFDYTAPNRFAARLFQGGTTEEVATAATALGIEVQSLDSPVAVAASDPIQAFFENAMLSRGVAVTATRPSGGGPLAVTTHLPSAPDPDVRRLLDEARQSVAAVRDDMEKQVSELKKDLASARADIAALKKKKTGPNE